MFFFFFFLGRKGNFLSIFLDASHAGLVNEHWDYGKNERSLKYVEHCLQHFPGFGVLDPERVLISWVVMEQSCEIRMGYTVPKYQRQGNMKQIGYNGIEYLIQKKIPFYFHVADDRESYIQTLTRIGFKCLPCGWHLWKCTPKKYCWLVPLSILSLSYQWKHISTNMVIYLSAKKKNHPVIWGPWIT